MGLSDREAARELEGQAERQLGSKIWTAEQIRRRFAYHTGKYESDQKRLDIDGTNRTREQKKSEVSVKEESLPEGWSEAVVDCNFASDEGSPITAAQLKKESEPLRQLKRWWKMGGKKDRKDFLKWVDAKKVSNETALASGGKAPKRMKGGKSDHQLHIVPKV